MIGDDAIPVNVAICARVYNEEDETELVLGNWISLEPKSAKVLKWKIPDTSGYPVAGIGIAIVNPKSAASVYLSSLDWHGAPTVHLTRRKGTMWSRAWVNGVDTYHPFYPESFRLIQNRETGLLMYGSRDWQDFEVSADVTPHLVKRSGIAARVQGMKRYYALVITAADKLQLVRELDGTTVLAEIECDMQLGHTYQFSFRVQGNAIYGQVGDLQLHADDHDLKEGGIALLVDEGRTATKQVSVRPV